MWIFMGFLWKIYLQKPWKKLDWLVEKVNENHYFIQQKKYYV